MKKLRLFFLATLVLCGKNPVHAIPSSLSPEDCKSLKQSIRHYIQNPPAYSFPFSVESEQGNATVSFTQGRPVTLFLLLQHAPETLLFKRNEMVPCQGQASFFDLFSTGKEKTDLIARFRFSVLTENSVSFSSQQEKNLFEKLKNYLSEKAEIWPDFTLQLQNQPTGVRIDNYSADFLTSALEKDLSAEKPITIDQITGRGASEGFYTLHQEKIPLATLQLLDEPQTE